MTEVLTRALRAGSPGVVAEAARVVSSRAAPPGAENPRAAPPPTLVEALGAALDARRSDDEVETRMALADAAGALRVLSLKPRIERLCAARDPALRDHARRALDALGGSAGCAEDTAPRSLPDDPAIPGPVTLTFVTDGGRLGMTVDPALAPLAAARIVALARSGSYDGMIVHRVAPGMVVQLGDRLGDGFGGAGRTPVPAERSPTPFRALDVGLALAGRDTGSSQLFVTLAARPDLAGDYPFVGHADPEWADVIEGDVVDRVEVRP